MLSLIFQAYRILSQLPFGFACGNSFSRAFRALRRCHCFQSALTADPAPLRALLTEELQNIGRQFLSRHAFILTPFGYGLPLLPLISKWGLDIM